MSQFLSLTLITCKDLGDIVSSIKPLRIVKCYD